MSRDDERMLALIEAGCRTAFGGRLRACLAFGSRARGTEREDSDLDVLIILDRIDHYAREVDLTGELIADLSLRCGISISRVFISENEWLHGDSMFLQNVREEAVAL